MKRQHCNSLISAHMFGGLYDLKPTMLQKMGRKKCYIYRLAQKNVYTLYSL